jgi:hypothetical protein
MRTLKLLVFLAALLAPFACEGQYPYPYGTRRVYGGPSTNATTGPNKGLAGTFHGTLKTVSKKEVVIENDDDQVVSLRRSGKTKFFKDDKEVKPTEIAAGTVVSIDAGQDIDLKPTALAVRVDPPPKKSEAKQ